MIRPLVKARLRPIVRNVLRDLVAEEFGTEHLEQATDRLLHRIGAMPPHLGAGIAVLTLTYESHGVARYGQAMHALPADKRRRLFKKWKTSPVGPLRDWTQFYEKMGVFVYWSTMEDRGHAFVEGAHHADA